MLFGSRAGPDRWSVRVAWELFAMESDGPNAFEWRVLGKLARYQSVGDEIIFELNPFFRYERKGEDYTYFSLLMWLYSYEREGRDSTHRILQIPVA